MWPRGKGLVKLHIKVRSTRLKDYSGLAQNSPEIRAPKPDADPQTSGNARRLAPEIGEWQACLAPKPDPSTHNETATKSPARSPAPGLFLLFEA